LAQGPQPLRLRPVRIEVRPGGVGDFAHVQIPTRIDRDAMRREEPVRRIAGADVADAGEAAAGVVEDADARSPARQLVRILRRRLPDVEADLPRTAESPPADGHRAVEPDPFAEPRSL